MTVRTQPSEPLSGIDRRWRDSVIAVFDAPTEAEHAVRELDRSGFDMKKLSVIGKVYDAEEHPVGFYTTGERIKTLGGSGAFWGGLWEVLFGAAFFWISGVGAVAVAGPLVRGLVSGLEGATLFGAVDAVAGALASLGVPHDSAVKYETQLKANNYLVIARGSPQEVEHSLRILQRSAATETEVVSTRATNIARHVSIS